MEMTEQEIVKKYKENSTKKGYTNILAQLNACSKQEINEILRRNGVNLPGNPNFTKVKNVSQKYSQDRIVVKDEIDKMETSESSDIKSVEQKLSIPDSVKLLISDRMIQIHEENNKIVDEVSKLKEKQNALKQELLELSTFCEKFK